MLANRLRFNAVHEFIDPIATTSLNLPYVIRSRLLFATAHLFHQVNLIKATDRQDDLPLDNEIYMETADKYAAPWKNYGKLKQALEKIGGKRPMTAFGPATELGEVLEIIPEISPGLSTELRDYGADGDHYR